MTLFTGRLWLSDFEQQHDLYPGPAYRHARPSYTVYRHPFIYAAPPANAALARGLA